MYYSYYSVYYYFNVVRYFKNLCEGEQLCGRSQEILPLGRKLKLPCIISFKKILPLRPEGVILIHISVYI